MKSHDMHNRCNVKETMQVTYFDKNTTTREEDNTTGEKKNVSSEHDAVNNRVTVNSHEQWKRSKTFKVQYVKNFLLNISTFSALLTLSPGELN